MLVHFLHELGQFTSLLLLFFLNAVPGCVWNFWLTIYSGTFFSAPTNVNYVFFIINSMVARMTLFISNSFYEVMYMNANGINKKLVA